tara:strand:- start:3527 stop:3715 length:189 start_codon:yes stop_codon:yes gene_type:complete
MIKEFEIKEILSAVNSISKIKRKKGKTKQLENDFAHKDSILTTNDREKSYKSDILVLDQMIE